MTRNYRIRLIPALALILALLGVQVAGARPAVDPPGVQEAIGGWFGNALTWLEELAGFRPPVPGHRNRSASQSVQKGGNVTPTGSSCIDPVGNPRCGA